ncbi:MAG: fused MFS/spermidine synthase [Planctomycetota bacterium]
MPLLSRSMQFRLFFLSGFSGLVYQIVWLRLAFAAFGVITPVISVVLSVFMLGLGAGSWFAGSMLRRWTWTRRGALRAYAAAEFLIGVGGLAVPMLFMWGESLLLPVGQTDSVQYLGSSAAIILFAMVPFCLCMGTTFPFMMQAIRGDRGSEGGFSYLYLANVLGALAGTFLTPVALVELLGFRGTLVIGLLANWCAAAIAFRLSLHQDAGQPVASTPEPQSSVTSTMPRRTSGISARFALCILFTTGLASMGMEVVWTRAFAPVLLTQVYSFAGLLFSYLLATWCGSMLYRRHLARARLVSDQLLLALLALAASGQILAADPRIVLPAYWMQIAWLLLSIAPYCAILGYLTPKLIDEHSLGRPDAVGHAYAVNVLGCIVGPLIVSYVLLPKLGLQWAGIALALPLWALSGWSLGTAQKPAATEKPRVAQGWSRLAWGLAVLCGLVAATVGTSYEDRFAAKGARVYRDHTATVIAGVIDGRKDLLVNGKSITAFTPSTKLMAHLPLAQLSHQPKSALVICFGMGVTYRSLLSWNIETTAVELVPSVSDAFGFFFADADEVRRNPQGHIIIDDGRRFLRRTTERFDVITLDPPPPVEAAGSSLLYSREFYQLIKPRLAEGGILQQWYPGGDFKTFQAILRSVLQEFPHVRVTRAFDGWGYHMLCSLHPLPDRTASELFARMPETARKDLVEWNSDRSGESFLEAVIASRVVATDVLSEDPTVIITDDRPYNEYYLLRRCWEWWTGTYTIVL